MGREPAVAQHSEAVAQAEDLVEAVRDVEDDLALRAQAIDQREEDLAFAGRE